MNQTENVKVRVMRIVAEHLGIDQNKLSEDSELTDLGADSLDKVEIAMEFEEEFGIEISDEQTDDFKTIGSTIAHIQAMCA